MLADWAHSGNDEAHVGPLWLWVAELRLIGTDKEGTIAALRAAQGL